MKRIVGVLSPVGDKSISHRYGLISPLFPQPIEIQNFSPCLDVQASLRLVQSLGVRVESLGENRIRLIPPQRYPGGLELAAPVDCANSGTTARLGMGLMAGLGVGGTLIGDASLSRRPMRRVVDPLRRMGSGFSEAADHLPITLFPKAFHGGEYASPVDSAQVKSSLLFASIASKKGVTLAGFSSSRDHTERLFGFLGAPVSFYGKKLGFQPPSILDFPVDPWRVPGDFSSAAFFIVGALLLPGSDLYLQGVNLNLSRLGLLRLLEQMGGNFERSFSAPAQGEEVGDLRVRFQKLIAPPPLDTAVIPTLIDEVPILALLLTSIPGHHELRGLGELRVKESDRIQSTVKMLKQLGGKVEELEDGILIQGGAVPPFNSCLIDCQGDHRIAMTARIAGLAADGPVEISDPGCIAVSDPSFDQKLASVVKSV